MICDLNSVYKKRNKNVRFYETESGAEFDKRGFLIGLNNEDLSDGLRDKIMDLSPFLQEVFASIQKNIHYQRNEIETARMEREAYEEKGFVEDRPGYWKHRKSGKVIKGMLDYPVNLGEKEEEIVEP